jgi:NAD(P)-dependent dehydrogenase (short-subunit alcohol dehydrogenase family)
MWSVKNKICVVSGSSSGLGFETSKALRDEGAVLNLIVRNQARKDDLIKEFPNATYYFADFSNLQEIKKVSQAISLNHPKIDLLVNNAGVISYDTLTLTEDGLEATITINYLSHYILTETLLPNLTHDQEARIVSTGSLVHRHSNLDFDNLHHKGSYKPMKMYATSKMMLVMYSHHLGQKLNESNVNTHCVDPGAVATQISRSRGPFFNFIFSFGKFFLTGLKKGSKTNIYGCLSAEISSETSTYLIKQKMASAHDKAFDQEKWRQLEAWTNQVIKDLD